MADSKISALGAVTDVQDTDELVMARAGATKKIDASDLRVGIINDGWIVDLATWTYASASTFTVTGDRTSTFQKGTRLRFTQTTVKYGVVASSSHAAGTTTVTIVVNTDYTLANAAITVTSYSHAASPAGYPGWFGYTPTYTGFSAAPAAGAARFNIIGRQCTVIHDLTTGTSNATGFTLTLPVTSAVSVSAVIGRVYNNSAFQAAGGLVDLTAASGTANLYRDGTGATWTNSNLKTMSFSLTFGF